MVGPCADHPAIVGLYGHGTPASIARKWTTAWSNGTEARAAKIASPMYLLVPARLNSEYDTDSRSWECVIFTTPLPSRAGAVGSGG